MEFLNFDEYIKKNPNHKEIEFKIFKMKNRDGIRYYIKFLTYQKRLFKKPLPVWVDLCYASGHSNGFDWHTRYFNTQDWAEQFIDCMSEICSNSEIVHFMKRIT